MTAETTSYLVLCQQSTKRVLQRRGDTPRRTNGKVESFSFGIKANQTFVELSSPLKHVSLAHPTLAKRKRNRNRDRVLPIRHRIETLFALSFDFVFVRTGRHRQLGIVGEYSRLCHRLHCHRHAAFRVNSESLLMTFATSLIAYELRTYGSASRVPFPLSRLTIN